MKRSLVGAAILADALFSLSLGADAWQTVTVFVAIVAAVVLAWVAWDEHVELKKSRRYTALLEGRIAALHPPTSFQPYEGDEGER